MGTDKALVAFEGELMYLRAARILREGGCSMISVISRSPLPGDESIDGFWTDVHGGQGPLDGLITALRNVQSPYFCLLAIDLPRVTPPAISRLWRTIDENETLDVAHLSAPSGPQALAACWRSRVLERAESFFDSGGRSVHDLVGGLRVATLAVSDSELLNVNSPAQMPGAEAE